MSTAAFRAGAVCGALVGVCSALLTAAAHAAVAGSMPSGAAAAMVLLISGSVGAISGAAAITRSRTHAGVLAAALVVGQILGHVALSLGHGGHDLLPSAPMLAAHAAAAVALGVLISLVSHLYVVCASVLCWLSLVFVHRSRPAPRPIRETKVVVARPVLFHSGLGMRAPPRLALS
ncbi:hypothetical protein JRC04_27715 [Mycolicibacterium sp. S2-37]|uniref:hypothetical protein n=1 Tax=Mycolicibacterium sp. S2-37 TaxID=2810297 RepID=UPI001A944882|nr:hypothetical protein [Mycolicibacterium sp. S2-37]MBO0681268.1 hypothetical protein [Mycolicibacterium sp. S2-37]